MRWPWSKPEPDPVEEEIAERMVEHQTTLKRVGRVLSEATREINRTARLMDDYNEAEQRRGRREP